METKQKVIYLDGAMGTQIQEKGLPIGERPEVFMMKHPELIADIHRSYVESGSDIVYANTFGANAKKLKNSGYTPTEIITTAIAIAKKAVQGQAQVALDIGPLGEMLEPNGYLSFHEAYALFQEQVIAGTKAGADLIVIETMSDLYEVKAALLAARENSSLPIFVTMSFEADGRSFTGCTCESFALLATRLGAAAVGINCSLGPTQILPIAQRMAKITPLPLIIKANAGLPDPLTNTYTMDAESFAQSLLPYQTLPVRYIGGCCGTTPAFLRVLKETLQETSGTCLAQNASYVCTPTRCIAMSDVRVIGERINPTGNKVMKKALQENDLDAIVKIALDQVEAGAEILDVNVGLPGIDEKAMMCAVIAKLQEVIDVPLQIDSTDPEVIAAALRISNGIYTVNSINGEQVVMDRILPHVAAYGANVVGLTMDEQGLPQTAQQRIAIAEKILAYAQGYGIAKERVFLDCLTLTLSAQQAGAMETLQALSYLTHTLHVSTVLGVSNISFGLPCRQLLNQSFLLLALSHGLTMPIINPNQEVMMDAVRSWRVFSQKDVDAMAYIDVYAHRSPGHMTTVKKDTAVTQQSEESIEGAIAKGLKEECRRFCIQLLQEKEPLRIVNEHLIPALDAVGNRYEKKEIYLPQLIRSASASQCAFDEIRKYMQKFGQQQLSRGKILLATVKGDVHDIGKNIVKVVLENYGYEIVDLGKDVPVEAIVQTAIEQNIYLIGLSALMTTTLVSMKKTIQALHASGHPCKIMVGGAVVSPAYAQKIQADYYAKDAKESADIAREVLG